MSFLLMKPFHPDDVIVTHDDPVLDVIATPFDDVIFTHDDVIDTVRGDMAREWTATNRMDQGIGLILQEVRDHIKLAVRENKILKEFKK